MSEDQMDQTNEQIQKREEGTLWPALLPCGWWSWLWMYLGVLLFPGCPKYKMGWCYVCNSGEGSVAAWGWKQVYVLNDSSLGSSQICAQLLWLEVFLDLRITARLGDWKMSVKCYPWAAEFKEHVRYCVKRLMWIYIFNVLVSIT